MVDDDLPQEICSECLTKLQQSFDFKRMCETSNNNLQTYLTNKNMIILPHSIEVTESYTNDDQFDENQYEKILEEDVDKPHMEDEFLITNRAKRVNGRYQCELCEKSLADRRTFLLHTRLHLGKNLKHCDICGRGFAKQNHLNRHLNTHSVAKVTSHSDNHELNQQKNTEVKNVPHFEFLSNEPNEIVKVVETRENTHIG